MVWLKALAARVKEAMMGPDEKLLYLISELRRLQAELLLATTMEAFEGLEHFMETLSPWQDKSEIARLIVDFEASAQPGKDSIVTALFEIELEARDAIKAGAVIRFMNRNTVAAEKTDLPRQIKELVRRRTATLSAAIDELHELALELAV